MSSGARAKRKRVADGAGKVPAPAPLEQQVLEVRVFYAQVPDQLADRFRVQVSVDDALGSLIRSLGAFYAFRAVLVELERQQLLAPAESPAAAR